MAIPTVPCPKSPQTSEYACIAKRDHGSIVSDCLHWSLRLHTPHSGFIYVVGTSRCVVVLAVFAEMRMRRRLPGCIASMNESNCGRGQHNISVNTRRPVQFVIMLAAHREDDAAQLRGRRAASDSAAPWDIATGFTLGFNAHGGLLFLCISVTWADLSK